MTRDALKELRKIVQMPDQKHWNCTEMRERALEEWVQRWVIDVRKEQAALNYAKMPLEAQDHLKEQLINVLLDEIMQDVAEISTESNKIAGGLTCLRRKPKS